MVGFMDDLRLFLFGMWVDFFDLCSDGFAHFFVYNTCYRT
jgi:hypothetical protein